MKFEPFKILSARQYHPGVVRHFLEGHSGGWAYAFVDDLSGILVIVSDWETWSYRWHATPEALGAPTLTHFLGMRGDPDYTGRKLTSEHGRGSGPARSEFDQAATERALKKALCERRLEVGRRAMIRGRSPGALSAEKARDIWDDIERIEDSETSDLFFAHVYDIHGYNLIDDDIYEHAEYVPTNSYKVLTECILPALFTSCAQVVAARQAAAQSVHTCECCS